MVLLYSVNECPNSLSELSHTMQHADALFLSHWISYNTQQCSSWDMHTNSFLPF